MRLSKIDSLSDEISLSEFLMTWVNLARPPWLAVELILMSIGMVSANSFGLGNFLAALSVSVPLLYTLFAPNDYFDAESDAENDRKGGFYGDVALGDKKIIARYASYFGISLSLVVAFLFEGLARYSILAMIFVSISYSVPPLRLRSVPLVDSVIIGIGAFLSFSIGIGIAGGGWNDIIGGMYWFSAIAAAWNGVGTLYDIKSDKEAGIRTTGTLLGWRKTIFVGIAVFILAIVFETWSKSTKIFLYSQIALLSVLLISPKKKTWNLVFHSLGLITCIFGAYWIYVRI